MDVHVYVCLIICGQEWRVFDGNLGRRGAQMACLSTSDCPCVAVFILRSVVLRLFD